DAALAVEAMFVDVRADLVAHLAPALHRPLHQALARCPDAAVEADPGQDLGVHEVRLSTAHLPDAAVRLAPAALQVLEDGQLEVPERVVTLHAVLAGDVQHIEHFPAGVELELGGGLVADAHGPRVAVAR